MSGTPYARTEVRAEHPRGSSTCRNRPCLTSEDLDLQEIKLRSIRRPANEDCGIANSRSVGGRWMLGVAVWRASCCCNVCSIDVIETVKEIGVFSSSTCFLQFSSQRVIRTSKFFPHRLEELDTTPISLTKDLSPPLLNQNIQTASQHVLIHTHPFLLLYSLRLS